MSIRFDERKQQFHLSNDYLSYVMEIVHGKYLVQVYYGEKISKFSQVGSYPQKGRSSFSPSPNEIPNSGFSLDFVPQEFPGYDTGDYRDGMIEATFSDGTKAVRLEYISHNIHQGKEKLNGLPATYVLEEYEADTLEIVLGDPYRHLQVKLSYTLYRNRPVLTKSVQYINVSQDKITLEKALSSCLDLPDSNYDLIQMPGAWAREKDLKRNHLIPGNHVLDSKRGASGVVQQPFIALAAPETTEFSGEVFGFHFIYSGNFQIETAVDTYNQTRVLMGINSFNFTWILAPEEVFQTPEVVFVYSNQGLNGMSQAFHKLYRERLVRGNYQYEERPILINNWETTYFDFNQEKLLKLVDDASKIGIELFVLDDGWFGKRDSDTTSLGDWVANKKKLPEGLEGLVSKVKEKGLKFGLWFEPEMISEKSDLFADHPDWYLQVEHYPSSLGRNQLVLDLSRKEVREHIYQQMTTILDQVPLDYIKWDMNRNFSEVGSVGQSATEQMKTSHRYILGLYEILEKLTARYPDILFENCSGGGGRFDPGMAYYMPQSWVSDNTDAIERLKIQYSTSMIFPPVMMCAHLSDSPNQQVGRITDIETRTAVAMSGNLGIMMDLAKESPQDVAYIQQSISWYKKNRKLLQFGDFYRLLSPYDTNYGAWMFVDETKSKAVVFFIEILSRVCKPWVKLKLYGLDPKKKYAMEGQQIFGDELMNYGLYINNELSGDFKAKIIEIEVLE